MYKTLNNYFTHFVRNLRKFIFYFYSITNSYKIMDPAQLKASYDQTQFLTDQISKLDRDFNASKNILKEGIKIISSGTDDYRHGDEIRPVLTGTICEVFKKKEIISPETH